MLICNGAIMPTLLTSTLLAVAMMLPLLQAEDAAPAPAAPAAAATDLSDLKAVFGIIAISKDHKVLTLTDGKGTVTKLKITAKTDATIDLKKVDLDSLSTTKTVRVSFTGDTVDSIDELSDAKKKKNQ
jgi:hypothetical protein